MGLRASAFGTVASRTFCTTGVVAYTELGPRGFFLVTSSPPSAEGAT